MVELKENKCKKCLHKWISRTKKEPVQCPRCKRTDWNNQVLSGSVIIPIKQKEEVKKK